MRSLVLDAGVISVAVVLLVSPGCDSKKPRMMQRQRLLPMPQPYVADIPVPVSFAFVEDVSEDRATGTQRLYLRHVYRGDARKYDVRRFYNEEMPRHRWVKTSDGHVKGRYTLRFEKGDETCTVLIHDAPGRRYATEIQVLVSQEQRGTRPPGRRRRR